MWDLGFPAGSDSKESSCNTGNLGQPLGQEDPLEKGKATLSSILAWRIPLTEEPGGLQAMGSQRVGHKWATNTRIHTHIHTYMGSSSLSRDQSQPPRSLQWPLDRQARSFHLGFQRSSPAQFVLTRPARSDSRLRTTMASGDRLLPSSISLRSRVPAALAWMMRGITCQTWQWSLTWKETNFRDS